MGERPNVHREVLEAAAIRFGDARLAWDRHIKAVYLGDGTAPDMSLCDAAIEAEGELLSAARAYATRMRRKPKAARP